MKKHLYIAMSMLILVSCYENVDYSIVGNLKHSGINNTTMQKLSSDIATRTSYKSIKDISSYFMDGSLNENFVLSPASYLLAVSGLASVTDGFDNSSYGLSEDAMDDVDQLLNSWNFEYDDKDNGDYCYFKSAILHQQVGDTYKFDEEKRDALNSKHISTLVSSPNMYRTEARNFFHNEIGMTLDIPKDAIVKDGIITYSALTMKDYVADGMVSDDDPFTTYNNKSITTSSYEFGLSPSKRYTPYYKGNNYQVFCVGINYTSMLIVLPDEGVDIHSIDVGEAYQSYQEHKEGIYAYGYVPYFHIKTENQNLTKSLSDKLTGNEIFYSELLEDDVLNDLSLSFVLQSSDFEFNKYGVSGESITTIGFDGSAAPSETPDPIPLYVNRPFYAISMKDSFPLFVSMVLDPSQTK